MIASLVNLLIIALIIYLFYRRASKKPLHDYFFPALGFKILSGLSVGIIYKYYYQGGDTFNLFYDAVSYSQIALHSPSLYVKLLLTNELPPHLEDAFIYSDHHRALVTSKILSVFTLITRNNYWISGIYFSLFSFSGMWYLANNITEKYKSTKIAAVIGFLFFPTVIFWSSGILKESLIMGALCFLSGFLVANIPVVKRSFGKNIILVGLAVLFLGIIWQLKYYYLAIFLPVSITTVLVLFIRNKFFVFSSRPLLLLFVWICLFILFLAASTQLYPTLNVQDFLFFLLHTHDTIYQNSDPENLIHYHNLNDSFSSLFRNLPVAVFAGLFRPGIWDINTSIQIIPALENLFILVSAALALKNFRKSYSVTDKILLFSIIIYILLLGTLMAFAAPNFGTLVRYKIGFLPFLVYLVCIDNPLLRLFIKSGT